MALPSLTGWQSESLRVTFFASEPVNAVGKNWWAIATGSNPETVSSKPATSEHSEIGPFGTGILEMKVSFNRIDWLYMPVMTPESAFPAIGKTEDILNALHAPISNWLAYSDLSWIRLAYGHVALLPVSSITEANEAIKSYISIFNVDQNAARDIVLQINYPCQSDYVKDLAINRVSKLMSATAQIFNITPNFPIPTIKNLHFFRAEFDINTAADRAVEIPRERLNEAVSELSSHFIELISSGVKP